MTKVTVLMAVYNSEAFLKESIDSLLGQTMKEIQIVCIDDASTDASLGILNGYALRDNRVEVIRLVENKGQAHARNIGLKQAKGQYVCMLDADDSLSPDALAEAVRTLANYGSSKKYVFKYTGRNSRLDEIQAAVLDVKLKYLVEDNAHRKQVANYYYDHINNPLITLPDRLPDEQNVYHLFPILVGKGKRDALHDYLEQNGVGTVIHYPIAPHKQECYKEWNHMSFPITERIADEELSLPIGPSITFEEVAQVVKLINNF